MADPKQADIVVVGAGIIGVACALQLARQGRR
ncbi:FAD-dependent oxidoreductase, partial [Pseudomonas sp. Env-33]